MAAPAETTIQNLNGEWVMDKTISTSSEPILALQGMGWMTRKGISYATITLTVNQYTDSDNVGHIDIDQTLTGGIKGTTEKRIADWNIREHKDHIFGTVAGQSRFLKGVQDEDGKTRPNVEVCTRIGGNGVDDAKIKKFLRGEILADDEPCDGFLVEEGDGQGVWFQSFVENKDEGYGWTAEQIWGFEMVNGERRYTRRIAVAKDDQYELARFVYTFNKKE